MTDKYCPLRFREFGSQPHDQRCIGEYCAWFEKCSQSHGEPIYGMTYGNMEPRQVIATEEPQEPREVDENACTQDTREKLEADLNKRIVVLQAQLDKLSSDELHWRSEADFWKRKYELICKALIDLNRNYVHVEDEGLA